MIVFQSPAMVEVQNHRSCYSPSPGGEGRGEGELNRRGRQSALIEVCPCSPGTFENSQQHARVIYGWGRRSQPAQSPAGTAEIIMGLSGLKYESVFIGVHPWLKTYICKIPSRFLKAIKGHSRLFKLIQGFFGKNIFLFFISRISNPILVGLRLRLGLRPSSAAFKSDATLSPRFTK